MIALALQLLQTLGAQGGACGSWDEQGKCDAIKLHAGHTTQEEDIVSNWLLTSQHILEIDPSDMYAQTICGTWGMVDPTGTSAQTVQRVVYSSASASDYNDAWIVRNALLSRKKVTSAQSSYEYLENFEATLVFVAGPNANNDTSLGATSTMRRTYNKKMENYSTFRKAVKTAQYACLQAMAAEGCQIAMLAYVSAGLYAGKHSSKIRKEYKSMGK